MDVTSRIAGYEGELRQLITKWERFFSGDIRVPPVSERDELGRRLRVLSEHQSVQRVSDRFRIEQLQHRFMAYSANWERLLREREEGFRRGTLGRVAPLGSADGSAAEPNASPSATVDTSGPGDLFARWSAAKRELSQDVRVDQAAFEAQIEGQRRQLESKLGAPVVFDVRVENDKVKLTARRVAGADGEE